MSARLPPYPNLERLKNESKSLLRAYQRGDPQALSRLAVLQRIPAKKILLADAQRVIAAEYGFSSWAELIQTVKERGMSRWYGRSVFFTTDVEKSIQVYEHQFGFKKKWDYDEEGKLVAAQVNRNGVEIILNLNPPQAGHGRIFMALGPGQTNELADEFTKAGAAVSFGNWGMPVMFVADLDGNELFFHDDEIKVE